MFQLIFFIWLANVKPIGALCNRIVVSMCFASSCWSVWHCLLLEDHLTSERERMKSIALVCLWCQSSRPLPVPGWSCLPQTWTLFLLRTPLKDARGIKPKIVLCAKRTSSCSMALDEFRSMTRPPARSEQQTTTNNNALFLRPISILFPFFHCAVCARYSSGEMLQLKCKWSLRLVWIISGPHDHLGSRLHFFLVSVCICVFAECLHSQFAIFHFLSILMPQKFMQFPTCVRLWKNYSRMTLKQYLALTGFLKANNVNRCHTVCKVCFQSMKSWDSSPHSPPSSK